MNVPEIPQPHRVRHLKRACPFCNETLAALWCDPMRESFPYQVRCSFCDARGPWNNEGGAVEAWLSVRPVEHDEAQSQG